MLTATKDGDAITLEWKNTTTQDRRNVIDEITTSLIEVGFDYCKAEAKVLHKLCQHLDLEVAAGDEDNLMCGELILKDEGEFYSIGLLGKSIVVALLEGEQVTFWSENND